MEEKMKAYLREFDSVPSLENIDFETSLILKKVKKEGDSFEFGGYDPRDGSVEVIVQRPDVVNLNPFESEQEWHEKRKWYLSHAKQDYKLFCEGIMEGYLLQDNSSPWGLNDDWAELEDWDGYCDDWFQSTPWWERLEDRLEWEERDKQERKIMCEKMADLRSQRKIDSSNGERRITKSGIKFISQIAKADNLVIDLPDQALNSPWETYELLKQSYCAKAGSVKEYDKRIAEVIYVLRI